MVFSREIPWVLWALPCCCTSSLTSNCLPADIPVTSGGFDLLGSPVGSSAHCLLSVLRRIEKLQEVLAKLGDLQDSQMETSLLRSCLSLSKVAYALRTCPPRYIWQALVAFDDTMQESLADLAGGPLPDWAWLKTSLPVSLGGLGIRPGLSTCPCHLHRLLVSGELACCRDSGVSSWGLHSLAQCHLCHGQRSG